MKFDLHCHSHFSDGVLSPEMLVSRAKEREVDVLALTDHDTIAGLSLAQKAAGEHGITLINGIEFSSQWGKGGVHRVGGLGDADVVALALGHLLDAVEALEDRQLLAASFLAPAEPAGSVNLQLVPLANVTVGASQQEAAQEQQQAALVKQEYRVGGRL